MLLKNSIVIKSSRAKNINYIKKAFNLTATSFGLQPIKLW